LFEMPKFARTIGIDYSGAQTPTASLKGLRVYLAEGDAPPAEIPPPHRRKNTGHGAASPNGWWSGQEGASCGPRLCQKRRESACERRAYDPTQCLMWLKLQEVTAA
jgi:hypothetical protein